MVFVIDDRYLVITAIITFVWQFGFYIPAALCKFDKVTDLAYGTNFVALAIITLFLKDTFYARQIVITIFVTIWGTRLAGYLFYRIIKIGQDHRFDGARENPFKFGIWFFFQFVIIWMLALPYTLLNASSYNPNIAWNDILGWILFVVGFICETVADQQKFAFKNNPENKNHWCDVGIWKYSRHPNYFGEIILWWGIFASCASILSNWEWFVIIGTIFLTVTLVFATGIPTTEKSTDQRFWKNEDYQEWKNKTPVLVPFIPGIFRGFAKVLFCCEWAKLYNYPPKEVDEKGKLKERD